MGLNRLMVIETLKKELKKQDISYRKLAEMLSLSEANVKRFFSEGNFSLQRLDEICVAIGIDFAQLVRLADCNQEGPQAFPPEAEEILAAQPDLLLLWYLAILGYPTAKIRQHLKVDKIELHRLARQLETMGIFEVLPHEKFRSKYPKSTRWRKDGPLAKKYAPTIQAEFFTTTFQGEQEFLDFLTGPLSRESYIVFKRKLIELFRQFDQLSQSDLHLPDENVEIFWLFTGIRPWAPIAVVEKAKGAT